MRVLVTGADGFVGRYAIPSLLGRGHEVIAAYGRGEGPPAGRPAGDRIRWVALELTDPRSVRDAAAARPDAVLHLAAVSSGTEARRDPVHAWEVNAVGTVRLLQALLETRGGGPGPRTLVVSTGEVYGVGEPRPRTESDPPAPVSPYAASKAAAEIAALEVWRRAGLPAIIARAFQHTGPGQPARFVVPDFVQRLREARRTGCARVRTGNLTPVRDLLDVRDVVEAYALLLESGAPGEIYNVARGEGVSLGQVFRRLAELAGVDAVPEPDPALRRSGDIPHLVGDPTKLRRATGWRPTRTLDLTLRDVVDAEAD